MAAKGDESKQQALIIALVCFVVLSLGLGVATYYGFAGQDELRKQAAEAKKEKDAQTKRGDWEQFQSLTMKAYVGQNLSKEDQENLSTLRRNYESGQLGKEEKNKPEVDALLDKLKQSIAPWDQRKQLPAENYFHKVETLDNDVAQLRAQLNRAREDYDKAKEKLDSELKATQGEKDDIGKALTDREKKLADQIKEKSTAFQALQKILEERDDEINDLKKKLDQVQEDKSRLTRTWQKKEKDYKTQNEKLKEQLAPPSVEEFNRPKAKIVKLDRTGKTAYIDIGAADNVKLPLTFSVVGVGPAGNANETRKGAIEVSSVLGPHLSSARITDVSDPGRNPVMEGDLLYNPSWSPTLRQHVAITGLIDLTGDGKDDTAEFVRTLEHQGIIVDAWLDLKDATIKGNGITRQTDFLVIGEQPEFDGQQPLRDGDVITNRKKAILEKISEMRVKATDEGVAVVPIRRFLGMIGYRLPKVALNSGLSNLPFVNVATESKEPAKPEGAKDAAKEKTDKDLPKEKEK
jgi:hypothetical protein